MPTFDQRAWRLAKRAKRVRRYRQRLVELQREADPKQWLAAIRRDDASERGADRQASQEAQLMPLFFDPALALGAWGSRVLAAGWVAPPVFGCERLVLAARTLARSGNAMRGRHDD